MSKVELSFEKMPHYYFSANRQFEPGEYHVNRFLRDSVLILMRKGKLRFTEDGINIELSEGEYYIQKSNTYQQGLQPSDIPNYYYIHFKGHYTNGGGLPIRGTFDIDKIQNIISIIDSLGNNADKLEYEKYFYELLLELKKNNSTKNDLARNIKTYLFENYDSKITLESLSNKFYLSPNQIINIYKSKYGDTPYHALLDFRLKKASELILATNESIQIIAIKTGFEDYTVFYKAFTKQYKLSPKKYRHIHSVNYLPSDSYYIPDK